MTAPYWTNGIATLYHADAREIPLPDKSVHCVVTSPPYWCLRDYGLSGWEGGDPVCGHIRLAKDRQKAHGLTDRNADTAAYGGDAHEPWPGGICGHCGARQQATGIGLEPTLSEWVANIVAVMREVRRVLRDDGTVWLNLGDAYAGSGKGMNADGTHSDGEKQASNRGSLNPGKRTPRGPGSGRWGLGDASVDGLPAKNLMGQPWRAAFALQDDGWILRSAIVWHKPNPMPESISDRPTSAYEMVFLLTKRPRYFYDADAVRQPLTGGANPGRKDGKHRPGKAHDDNDHRGDSWQNTCTPSSANLRNVWQISTQGRPEAHFATFPDELPRKCILAGTSEHGVCANCGAPWRRITATHDPNGRLGKGYHDHTDDLGRGQRGVFSADGAPTRQTIGWQPGCECNAARIPATVLDPFVGSGTTVAVAQSLGRKGIGLDLNPDYLAIARKRLEGITLPLPIGAWE